MLEGRAAEQKRIDKFKHGARGAGGTLIVRGEPRTGKSALLAYAAKRVEAGRVLRARGVESEVGLSFAGLHELLMPTLSLIDQLPERHARALLSASAWMRRWQAPIVSSFQRPP